MCGILIVHSKKSKLDKDLCVQSLNTMKNRGPDYSFFKNFSNDNLFIGQTVLSITGSIDNKIDNYHISKNGRYDLVLNGEIYNYKKLYKKYLSKNFKIVTQTDNEVLVNLHEVLDPISIYKSLDGMFAYSIYDKTLKNITIARDVIGEKILYKYNDDKIFIASSEIGPIIKILPGLKINREKLKEYFHTRHLLTRRKTPFLGIELIPPGNLINYDLRTGDLILKHIIEPSDFIDPDLYFNNKLKSSKQLMGELEELIYNTAKKITPKIDYYSVFSGGVDSSILSFYMEKINPPKGFVTLQFPEKDNTNLNLSPFEKKLGRKIDSVIVDTNKFAEYIPKCYKVTCSPFSTHSFVSQAILAEHVKQNNAKVLIGGDGADELFGGYEYYKSFSNKFKIFPNFNISAYSGYILSGLKFKNWNSEIMKNKINSLWDTFSRFYSFEKDPESRALQVALYSDSIIQLESVGIRSSDSMSMLYSVENRSPFLNKDIISFALNLPIEHKINYKNNNPHFQTKPLLKNLFVKIFGKKLLFPKQGFSGYPNEAARQILEKQKKRIFDYLNIIKKKNMNQATEWKLMNVEMFLNEFINHK